MNNRVKEMLGEDGNFYRVELKEGFIAATLIKMATPKHQIIIWDNGGEYSAREIYFVRVPQGDGQRIAFALDETQKFIADSNYDIYAGAFLGGRVIGVIDKGLMDIEDTCSLSDVFGYEGFGRYGEDIFYPEMIKIWAPHVRALIDGGFVPESEDATREHKIIEAMLNYACKEDE